MKQLQCYKLNFPNGLHLDGGGYGFENTETEIHSDAIFSAICSAAARIGGNSLLEHVCKVTVSSAFPYFKNKLFFPKPLSLNRLFLPNDYKSEKTFRKVRFLEKDILSEFLENNGDKLIFDDQLVKNQCWFKDNPNNIFTLIEYPRVVIDRVSSQTTIYHFAEVKFLEDAGLFFLADIPAESQIAFDTAVRFLGDEGLGADRTVGKGYFSIIEKSSFIVPENKTGAYYLLSLYNPEISELNTLNTASSDYDLIVRRGWSSAIGGMDLRRRSLRMFTEGSMLSLANPPKGRLVTVLENDPSISSLQHEVWRNGKALAL